MERDTSRTTHLQSSSLGFYARDLLRIALCTSSLAPSSRLLGLEAFCRFEGARELLMGIVELVLHSVLANADTAFYTFCITGRRLRSVSFPFGHGDVHMYRNAVVKREEQKTCLSTRTGPTTRRTCQEQRRSVSSCPSLLQRQLTATLSDLHSSTDLSQCSHLDMSHSCLSAAAGLRPVPSTSDSIH
jgi:hypothetical protein